LLNTLLMPINLYQNCATGKFSDALGATRCKRCPDGKSTKAYALNSIAGQVRATRRDLHCHVSRPQRSSD